MKALVAVLAISTTIAAASAVFVSMRTRPIVAPQAAAAAQPVGGTAELAAASRRTSADRLDLSGRLTAASQLDIRAAGSGFVLHSRVDPGDVVEKEQTLIELENPTLEDAARQAETALALAKSDLETQQKRRENAELHRDGMIRGSFGGRGLGRGFMRTAQNDEQQSRIRVTVAETAVQKAKQALADCQIVAPTAGYVAERSVRVGDRIDAGMIVLRLVDVSSLKLAVDASEAEVSQVIPPSTREVTVTFEAVPGRPFLGRVVRSLGGDSPSGQSSMSIEVANPDHVLKPGMAGRVHPFSGSALESSVASNSARFGSMRRESRLAADGPSDAELVRDMLVGLKTLATTLSVAADAQTKELTRKQEATKVTVDATTQYFGALEREVNDLRPENVSHHAVNLDKAADEIDNLAILHVDEELLAFGADVAQNLRAMAERRRSITRSRSVSDVIVSEEAQAENSAIRTQGIQRITIGLASMRRKMTKKYNLEFLANATNVHTASITKRRTARR